MSRDDRVFSADVQRVDLTEFTPDGRILDIGGGGEGIIGQLLGDRVVAIDTGRDELAKAPEGPLKIVMDAREMGFLNTSFDAVTSFFTLMYIERRHHQRVFDEVYRVLKDGGVFTIWDARIPRYPGGAKDIFVVPLEVRLADKLVSTAYGVLWRDAEQDMKYYVEMGKRAGFDILTTEEMGEAFRIQLGKPVRACSA
ncbi:MAG: class I SAM-dependent methyltransferase [Firmicutes bacterium]|jgi:ubiquinone/menaquinone biosynthesis C-methylase UbiE|nr:class I SAM-dependent methyltransferase [Bacillota bacterium]